MPQGSEVETNGSDWSVDLTPEEDRICRRFCRRRGITESQLITLAVAAFYGASIAGVDFRPFLGR